MKKFRIGVMGCANIAIRSVIPAIKELNNYFQLCAIASRSKEKANKYCEIYNCEPVVGYEKLLARNDIDAIYIPLPTGLHYEWIMKSLISGKHVYAEKSFAMNFLEAKEIVTLARKMNLALMEGYMFQYHSQHRKVLSILKRGEIGKIRNFSSSFGFPPLEKNNFRYDNKLGGGSLMDAAGYPLRATYFILGDDIYVTGANLYFDSRLKTNIYGSAFLKCANGIGAHISFGFDNFYQCKYEIWGSKGLLTVNKAFTPRPNCATEIIIETSNNRKIVNCDPDNHFIKAFIEFYMIITKNQKETHYNNILLQSNSLDRILELGK